MTVDTRQRNLDFILFALAFLLALALRLVRLGAAPLSDEEARWALQALHLARGLHPDIGPNPAYVMLTALTFFVFQANGFTARLVPALFGSLLVLAPRLFRDRLGNKPAYVLAFALAIEPGLLSLSRQAGSQIIVVSAALLAWGFWRNGRVRWAGFFAGIALLAGPALWPGLVGLALAYGFTRGSAPESSKSQPLDRKSLLTALGFATGTYLAIGSLFLTSLGGLGAGLASLPAYLGGWGDFTDVVFFHPLIGLLVYDLMAVLLGMVALVRGIRVRSGLIIFLGWWLLASLVIAIANPSRQVADLSWSLVPLWALASIEITQYLYPIRDGVWETLGMLCLTTCILAFAWFNFAAIALSSLSASDIQLRWIVIVGALALLILSVALVAFGWSVQTALQGSAWGLLIALSIYTLGATIAAGRLRVGPTVDMWAIGPQVDQAPILVDQMNNMSRWKAGAKESLDVAVIGLDSPALQWALRDWNATYTQDLTLIGNPSLVITTDQVANPAWKSGYRGESFVWRDYPGWLQASTADWLHWVALHYMPQGQQKIILWARNDVFVDSQTHTP